MKPLKVSETWLYRYRFIFGYALLITTGAFALFFRLGSLVPGINEYEASSAAGSLNIGNVISNPVNFIYHSLQYVSITALGPTPFAIRLPSIVLTIAALGLFFYVLDHRFSRRAAIITTLLFVTSSWLLNTVRLGGPMALTIALLLLLLFITTKMDKKYHFGWLIGLTVAAALSLYTPYFIYLLLAGIILSIPTIRRTAKDVKNRDLIVSGVIFIVLLIPLIYASVRDLTVAKTVLAIPEQLPSFQAFFSNVVDVIGHVIWSSVPLPILHLGDLPMLEIFSVSMVALGLYHYDHELTKNLSRLLLGGLLVVVLILGVSANQFDYVMLLPFVYFILTGGLVILFAQWNEIFPKNPLARFIAIVPIGLLLLIVGGYHTERYFIAWANNPEVVAQHSECYTLLNSELEQNSAYTSVLIADSEEVIMSPLINYYSEVMFTSDIDVIDKSTDERRLIITDKARIELGEEQQKLIGSPSRVVPSSSTSNATALWVYDVSL